MLGTGLGSRRWTAGWRVKLPLYLQPLPIVCIITSCLLSSSVWFSILAIYRGTWILLWTAHVRAPGHALLNRIIPKPSPLPQSMEKLSSTKPVLAQRSVSSRKPVLPSVKNIRDCWATWRRIDVMVRQADSWREMVGEERRTWVWKSGPLSESLWSGKSQAVCRSVCAVFLGNPPNLTENKQSDRALWISLENSCEMN